MSEFIETTSPAGRIYLHKPTRTSWAVDLEIGGAVWLESDSGEVITARADQLNGVEWERIA